MLWNDYKIFVMKPLITFPLQMESLRSYKYQTKEMAYLNYFGHRPLRNSGQIAENYLQTGFNNVFHDQRDKVKIINF